jgi:hypothetical protein
VARSSYIWVVQRHDALAAAFTVKHEMISWLEQQNAIDSGWWVIRMPDGPRRATNEPVTFAAEHFLDA